MPASSRRRRATTSSAEAFSATNMTVRPVARARNTRLATVCDLPVPGGPSTTRLRPSTASATTRAWAASAISGRFWAMASTSESASRGPAGSAKGAPDSSRRWATSGLSAMVRQSSSRSRHMR